MTTKAARSRKLQPGPCTPAVISASAHPPRGGPRGDPARQPHNNSGRGAAAGQRFGRRRPDSALARASAGVRTCKPAARTRGGAQETPTGSPCLVYPELIRERRRFERQILSVAACLWCIVQQARPAKFNQAASADSASHVNDDGFRGVCRALPLDGGPRGGCGLGLCA